MLKRITLLVGMVILALVMNSPVSGADVTTNVYQVTQIPLPGAAIPKYVTPLTVIYPNRVATGANLSVSYQEFQQFVLPNPFYATLPGSFLVSPNQTINPQLGTYVWGFKVGGAPAHYPGFSAEARKGMQTQVTYTNNLGTATSFPILQRYLTVDQTLRWANPLNRPHLPIFDPVVFTPYYGPQAVSPHLHGGEVRSDSDGGPDDWFTPGGEGPSSTPPAPGGKRGSGYSGNTLTYPNKQEAATIWFHDHALGITRLNVYAGLAAFYLLRDEFDTGVPGTGLRLPAGNYEVELAIQDRQFDTLGQWLFPDGFPSGLNGPPTNPDIHPFWIPEFFGDAIVVNGRTWPFHQVEPRRYRYRILNGSNARFYELRLENLAPPGPGPAMYVIGNDGGLLDAPARIAPVDRLVIAPGERYDVIIDFNGFNGQTLTLTNTANTPYPSGPPADPMTTGQIMQFRVTLPLSGPDSSFNPATMGATLRGGSDKPPAMVRLANGSGGLNPAVPISKKRQLILRETATPGGPVMVLLNNSMYRGLRNEDTAPTPLPGSSKIGANYVTEFPQLGSTEVWEIINLTVDAHPIHLHLVQFQIVNRQFIDPVSYRVTYSSLFPGGIVADGNGPPMNYNSTGTPGNPNYTGFYGGNPDVTPFLVGGTIAPLPQEAGWKDTVLAFPGQVTRLAIRWAPQNVPAATKAAGKNLFPFDPTIGPGYVWHCHILDHEDNEMMRPYIPTANSNNTFAKLVKITGTLLLLLLGSP